MRRIRSSLLLLLVLLPAVAQAQTRNARKDIATLEDAWIQAVIRRDAAAFNRLLHGDFIYTEDDRVYTRAQLIKEVTTGADTVTAGRNEDLTVRVHGDVAVATGWLVLIGRSGGNAFERRYRYTDTWVKVGSRWRVLAAQDYLKP